MRYLALLVLVVALAGCGSTTYGGQSDEIDQPYLEQEITASQEKANPGSQGTAWSTSCIKEDRLHFTCLVSGVGGTLDGQQFTEKVSCDESGGGTCVWRPE